jgi:hypothetical protein
MQQLPVSLSLTDRTCSFYIEPDGMCTLLPHWFLYKSKYSRYCQYFSSQKESTVQCCTKQSIVSLSSLPRILYPIRATPTFVFISKIRAPFAATTSHNFTSPHCPTGQCSGTCLPIPSLLFSHAHNSKPPTHSTTPSGETKS